MSHYRIAAILTCHNRREKTVACLRALREQVLPGWTTAGVEAPETCDERPSSPLNTVPALCAQPPATNSLQAEQGTTNREPRTRNAPCSSTLDPRPSALEAASPSTANSPVSGFSPQVSSLSSNRYVIDVFLTDDGCTDGTADAVRKVRPEATIIQGDGNLFWCGGMRVAWRDAAKSDPDYYLLLNDDTVLYPEAIDQLLMICPAPSCSTIAVGAICDPDSGEWTYGGLQSDFEFPRSNRQPRPCRTMNANCALIPRAVFERIGMFHDAFRHAMGDMDYGLAATRAGISLLETHELVGQCSRNPTRGTWRDSTLSRSDRLCKLVSPKGLPPRDWLSYCRRNCGSGWVRYFFSPYLRIITRSKH